MPRLWSFLREVAWTPVIAVALLLLALALALFSPVPVLVVDIVVVGAVVFAILAIRE